MMSVRKWVPFLLLLLLLVTVPALAAPGKPDFNPHIYADGEAWGTKVTTALPAPKKNEHSFDDLFIFTNGADGQLLVGDSAPGNPEYNGGRWIAYTATWTAEGMEAHDPLPVLKSDEEIRFHEDLGHLTVERGSPDGGPPPYFSCPLLPVHG